MPNTTADQLQSIRRLHARQAEQMQETWTRRHRFVVKFSVAGVDETSFRSFLDSLEKPCCAYTFTAAPPFNGPAVIAYSRSVLEGVTNDQLKGRSDLSLKPGQHVQQLHRDIMGTVITHDLGALERTWEPIVPMQVSDAELEVDPSCIGFAQPDDALFLIAFGIESHKINGLVSLAFAFPTLESVISRLT